MNSEHLCIMWKLTYWYIIFEFMSHRKECFLTESQLKHHHDHAFQSDDDTNATVNFRIHLDTGLCFFEMHQARALFWNIRWGHKWHVHYCLHEIHAWTWSFNDKKIIKNSCFVISILVIFSEIHHIMSFTPKSS